MNNTLLDLLVDPLAGGPLALKSTSLAEDGSVMEGSLQGAAGERYAIERSIPRFVRTDDEGQLQTSTSFGYKWGRRESYEDAGAILEEAKQIQMHLASQDAAIGALLDTVKSLERAASK